MLHNGAHTPIDQITKVRMAQSSPLTGDGENSTWQRNSASALKDIIKEAVIENLEIEKLLCGSTTFAIADLGCGVGPSTFYTTGTLIEAVQHKYGDRKLEFQVFFNDQTGSDFNTLFASLPHPRSYLAAGVPGSFYTRLFPSSSIHIAYSSNAIVWLSKVPDDSPGWNPGRIHYMGASDAVVKAYADQFEADVELFLRVRSEEIASGGMMMILVPGIPHADVQHRCCFIFAFLESILIDMVKEGVVEQELVDSFNIPTYFPSIKDVTSLVEKNGFFEIVKMEMLNITSSDGEGIMMHVRAMLGEIIAKHFSNEIGDQLFARAMQKKLEFFHLLQSSEMGCNTLLFAVLKRK